MDVIRYYVYVLVFQQSPFDGSHIIRDTISHLLTAKLNFRRTVYIIVFSSGNANFLCCQFGNTMYFVTVIIIHFRCGGFRQHGIVSRTISCDRLQKRDSSADTRTVLTYIGRHKLLSKLSISIQAHSIYIIERHHFLQSKESKSKI